MDGRPVFKWAVRLIEDSSHQVLDAAGFTTDRREVCWLLHQANIRILDAATDALGIDREQAGDRISTATATPRPAASRSRSTKSFRAGRFGAATCCCCAASAAASPGARR